ncbi:uncharacterized protein LOC129645921 isoform X15 [Bubalus kerabau]|uniref:uncharacterized protein LOC129645921 isoform X15 n=1 Tax=Bubalus carabanensis TaxID=3119969 RepID=UPI00244EA349|nr:uncharacterized protein LOC129645921 isoform X15 [Bubalus carabanensis]
MALTLLQGVMWPEPRTRSSVSMKIRGSVHKTPSPGPGTQWMNSLQRITSTVTCRPHLAPRLSAAREGVSSSPLPSESWLDSLPPAKKLSLEVSTRLYTTSPPSEGPGQYPAGILTSPPRAPSLRSFPGPLILSAGAQCPPLSP